METRNRRNDNGTAAVLAALFAGVSAIVVVGGALFFLSEDSESDSSLTATEAAVANESECEQDDIGCLADEAGVSEAVYLAQICEALGGTDCGATSQVAMPSNTGASSQNNTAPQSEDGDDADGEEDDAAEEEPEGPEEDPEEPAEPEDEDDGPIVFDPELLWCFLDNDGDGLLNCAEGDHGTNPNLFDTDGDGLGDAMEIGYSNPTDFDSDDDGLSDGAEVGWGTDPWSSDSDGDGWSDGSEVFWGTDPIDPDDEPFDIE